MDEKPDQGWEKLSDVLKRVFEQAAEKAKRNRKRAA